MKIAYLAVLKIMGYCGECNNHNVIFTNIKKGFHCSGCDEIFYYEDVESELDKRTLTAVRLAKKEGWKIYPNIELLGEPIDDVIKNLEKKIKNNF